MLTKERVFEIMGEYYGNEYYRAAIRLGISEDDLAVTAEILDRVNALGYDFSKIHSMNDVADIRFPSIVFDNYTRFKDAGYRTGLLATVHFRSYADFVPQLIKIYEDAQDYETRECVSQCLLRIRAKKYIPEYLRLVNQAQYGEECDFLIMLLCKLKVHDVKPKLLSLINREHDRDWVFWSFTFLQYAHVFKDPSLIQYVEPYLSAEDGEMRAMARKAMKKLNAIS